MSGAQDRGCLGGRTGAQPRCRLLRWPKRPKSRSTISREVGGLVWLWQPMSKGFLGSLARHRVTHVPSLQSWYWSALGQDSGFDEVPWLGAAGGCGVVGAGVVGAGVVVGLGKHMAMLVPVTVLQLWLLGQFASDSQPQRKSPDVAVSVLQVPPERQEIPPVSQGSMQRRWSPAVIL